MDAGRQGGRTPAHDMAQPLVSTVVKRVRGAEPDQESVSEVGREDVEAGAGASDEYES